MTDDERSIMLAGLEHEIGARSKRLASVMDFDFRRTTEGYLVPGDVQRTAIVIMSRAETARTKLDDAVRALGSALALYLDLRGPQ